MLSLTEEKAARTLGYANIAGIDEAGRGPLAGPVAAAAVILPADPSIGLILEGVRDSKQMTPRQRKYWSDRLKEVAVSYGIGFASAVEIDAAGILPATHLAVIRALAELHVSPDHLLLDYLTLPGFSIPQTSLVKGIIGLGAIHPYCRYPAFNISPGT